MSTLPKCIEIIGSGALGTFLSVALSKSNYVVLRSQRSGRVIKSATLIKDGTELSYSYQPQTNNLISDLYIYCGLMSSGFNQKCKGEVIYLSNLNGFVVDEQTTYIKGVIESLALRTEIGSLDNKYFYNSVGNSLPRICLERTPKVGFNSTMLRSSSISNQDLLNKSLRTLFYMLLSYENNVYSSANYSKNIRNKQLCIELLEILSDYSASKEDFISITMEFRKKLPDHFVPTICRDEKRFFLERELLIKLFNAWCSYYNFTRPTSKFSNLIYSDLFLN